MEGPSLRIASEQLAPFKGKKVLNVEGNTKLQKELLLGEEILDIFSWGKHLVFQFKHYSLRIHFLLWGSFIAEVHGKNVEGDYKKNKTSIPRLKLYFENGFISLFNCSIKLTEDKNIKKSYDFSVDIMSNEWDEKKALNTIQKFPDEEIGDVLLDQTIFSGVGNIIKNEVLWLCKVSPQTKVKDLSTKELKNIIAQTHAFSLQFYEWRKQFVLKKNLQIYRKKTCPLCNTPVIRKKTGKRIRWSYICPVCQK